MSIIPWCRMLCNVSSCIIHYPAQANHRSNSNKESTSTSLETSDRKFNIVLYGIDECASGTHRTDRLISDIDSVCQSVKSIVPSFDSHHVKDCTRLGKYSSEAKSHPQPLLVKLNCASIAIEILKHRTKLPPSSHIYIKPHLSPDERITESILFEGTQVSSG